MAIWKKASAVFLGGTEQIKQLKGRKVRTIVALEMPVYDPIHEKPQVLALAAGVVGLVANPHPTRFDFLIAFPSKTSTNLTTIEALMKAGDFKVVIVNEPTFKQQFEIEG